MFELYILLAIMIIGSIIAIEIRSLLSSVVSVGIAGFALCIIFLLLQAPDVAITQLIVEIVVLVILIRATGVRQDETEHLSNVKEWFAYITIVAFMAVFAVFSYYAFKNLPEFGAPLLTVAKDYMANGLAKTGAANLVTAVLLDFRAYDTLGEATILFTAILGTIAVLRRKGRKALNERDVHDS